MSGPNFRYVPSDRAVVLGRSAPLGFPRDNLDLPLGGAVAVAGRPVVHPDRDVDRLRGLLQVREERALLALLGAPLHDAAQLHEFELVLGRERLRVLLDVGEGALALGVIADVRKQERPVVDPALSGEDERSHGLLAATEREDLDRVRHEVHRLPDGVGCSPRPRCLTNLTALTVGAASFP